MKGLQMNEIWLDSRKVAQQFGSRPHLGRRIRLMTRRLTAGNLPYKSMFGREVPDTRAMNEVSLALKPIQGKPGFWQIMCEEQYRQRLELWCIDHLR